MIINSHNGGKIEFVSVRLVFSGQSYSNVFGGKNNKTLGETLEHPRYQKLASETNERHPSKLGERLGEFLIQLKQNGDDFYKKFLNKYGDQTFTEFKILDDPMMHQKGVYFYRVGDEIGYVGRCKDSMKKRVNNGYGKIHPKNCYIDGQATNCRMNALIAASDSEVTLWLHPLDSNDKITKLEVELLSKLRPQWNIQGA